MILRLTWYDAGTSDPKSKTGEPNGSIRNVEKYSHGACSGLEIAIDLCEAVKTKYPKISSADIYQLARVVAVELTRGPGISFAPGRKDSDACTDEGRLPDANQGHIHLTDVFCRMRLSDKDIVPAHTLGRAHRELPKKEGSKGLLKLSKDKTLFESLEDEDALESHKNLSPLSTHQTSIQSLPQDMMLEIFDRAGRCCAAVCQGWRKLYRSKQLELTIRESRHSFFPLKRRFFESLISLTLDFSLADYPEAPGGEVFVQPTDDDLSTVAAEFPQLQRIQLLGCDIVTSHGLTHLARGCQLAYIHLRDCRHFDDEAVLAVVRACRSLQHLQISLCEVTADAIELLRTLTVVTAHSCPRSVALALYPEPI
uniref:L-ascorbate peroxidase 3, peroxisomal n=1 Tax=Noccaea caerulescens TaxID=107243 RepID=A0A1J3HFF9_NOCCA